MAAALSLLPPRLIGASETLLHARLQHTCSSGTACSGQTAEGGASAIGLYHL